MKAKLFFSVLLISLSVQAYQVSYLNVELYDTYSYNLNSTSNDGILIEFTDDGYNGYDHRDAPKMNNLDENLASVVGSNLVSIENRALPQGDEDIQLLMNQFIDTDYTLWFDVPAIDGFSFKLVDHFEGVEHDLEVGENTVQFFIDPSNNASINQFRFKITVHETVVFNTNDFDLSNSISFYPNPLNNSPLFIELPSVGVKNMNVEIYNQQGKRLNSKVFNNPSNKIEIHDVPMEKGIYLVALNIDGKQRITKKIVR